MGSICHLGGYYPPIRPFSSFGSLPAGSLQVFSSNTGGGRLSTAERGSGKGSQSYLTRFLQPHLLGPQEGRLFQTGHRPFYFEPVYSQNPFQNGNFSVHPSYGSAGRLGCVSGSFGRLPSCSDSLLFPKVSAFCSGPGRVPVPRPPIRTFVSTEDIHQTHAGSFLHFEMQGNQNHPVPRRLVDFELRPLSPSGRTCSSLPVGSQTGPTDQPFQVRPSSLTIFQVRGNVLSDEGKPSSSPFGQSRSSFTVSQSVSTPLQSFSQTDSFTSGGTQRSSRPSSTRSPSHAPSSDVLVTPVASALRQLRHSGSSVSSLPSPPQLVEGQGPLSRSSPSPPSSLALPFYGCEPRGMGSTPRTAGPSSFGCLVSLSSGRSHQPTRTKSLPLSSEAFQESPCGSSSSFVHGQHHGGVLHPQTRGDSLTFPLHSSVGTTSLVSRPSDHPLSSPSSRSSQCDRGSLVKVFPTSSGRMVSESRGSSPSFPQVGVPNGGPFRHQVEQQTSTVRLPSSGSLSLGDRRHVSLVGPSLRVRFSTLLPDSSDSCKDPLITGVLNSLNCTSLAPEVVVHGPSGPSSGTTRSSSRQKRPSSSRSKSGSSSRSFPSAPSRLEVVQRSLSKNKFSKPVAALVAKARRQSTSRVYDAKWLVFRRWCIRRKIDPARPSVQSIADFLVYLFEEKDLAVSTVKGYRSMLSLTFKFRKGFSKIGSDPVLSELIRSFELARPVSRSLVPKWNLSVVLSSLTKAPFEPLDTASRVHLTWKTVFLLALASAKRRSELHAFSVDSHCLRFNNDGSLSLAFKPGFLAKNQLPSVLPPAIVIPSLASNCGRDDPDRLLCPVRSLKFYLKATKSIRGSRSRLFLPIKGQGEISAASISRWISSTIRHAYSQLSEEDKRSLLVRAHEVRALATSWAFLNHAPLSDILLSAFWRSSTTFSSFYLRDLASQHEDLFSLGPVVAAQVVVSASN